MHNNFYIQKPFKMYTNTAFLFTLTADIEKTEKHVKRNGGNVARWIERAVLSPSSSCISSGNAGICLKSIYHQSVNGNGSADIERWLNSSRLCMQIALLGDVNRRKGEKLARLERSTIGGWILSVDEFPNDNYIRRVAVRHRRTALLLRRYISLDKHQCPHSPSYSTSSG